MVEATAAVQMYLNRARANLEPGIEQLPIPEVWWEWLTTYRMWEANRKVFLYPENYLVPTLRSSSTRLFRALESDLMQVDITPSESPTPTATTCRDSTCWPRCSSSMPSAVP